jgi:hypothetical protein
LIEKLKAIGASYSLYAAMGSFVIYFLGYLVLRFQLSTWGVATDLAVLDERYWFAGARFLVYLTSTVVNTLFLASPFLLLWWALNRWTYFHQWRERWNYAVMGVVFAVLFIQFVEKKCFQFMDSLLLQRQLAGDAWLQSVLCDSSGKYEPLFSAGLVAGVATTGWLLFQSRARKTGKPALEVALASLLVVEFLMLPVNYGVIVSTRELTRVTNFAPAQAWLVWEGKDKTTFLVLDKDRKLVAVPNAEVKKIEFTGVDSIFQHVFREAGTGTLRSSP